MSDLLENIKNADPYADPDHVCDLIVEVVDEVERLRAQVAALREALQEIEYLDRPQERGKPRRVTIQEIARAALATGEKDE